MQTCRACLSADHGLQRINGELIEKYNLLIGFHIQLDDNLPQMMCQRCWDTVDHFITFRNQCIKSESSLHEVALEVTVKIENEDVVKTEFIEDTEVPTSTSQCQVKEEEDTNDDTLYEDEVCIKIEEIEHEIIDPIIEDELPNEEKCSIAKCPKEIKPTDIRHESKPEVTKRKPEVYELTSEVKKPKTRRTRIKVKAPEPEPKELAQLSCGLCASTFESKPELQTHIDGHKTDTTCGLCDDGEFREWPQMISHRVTHMKDPRELVCHVCWKPFRLPHVMEHHYLTEHYDKEFTGVQCRQCPKVYQDIKKMTQHIYVTHNSKSYICHHCNKSFTRRNGIMIHLQLHSDITYTCDKCDFSTKKRESLRLHQVRMHSSGKFRCTPCHRVFKSADKLAGHACAARAQVCPQCGLLLKNQHALQNHMKAHSSDVPYKCPRCPAAYKNSSNLRIHVDKHDNYRRFKCNFCDASFFSNSVLKKHKRTHTGEKPFVCAVCDKGFTGSHNLKVHMKVHGENLVKKKTST